MHIQRVTIHLYVHMQLIRFLYVSTFCLFFCRHNVLRTRHWGILCYIILLSLHHFCLASDIQIKWMRWYNSYKYGFYVNVAAKRSLLSQSLHEKTSQYLIACWVIFHAFVVACRLFSKLTISKYSFRNSIRVSNSLDVRMLVLNWTQTAMTEVSLKKERVKQKIDINP